MLEPRFLITDNVVRKTIVDNQQSFLQSCSYRNVHPVVMAKRVKRSPFPRVAYNLDIGSYGLGIGNMWQLKNLNCILLYGLAVTNCGAGWMPAKQGDYAYLLHIVRSLKSTGKGACILPHGVLFRGNAEAEIRRNLIQRGYIRGIIGLPTNLFYGTGIPACILVLDKEGSETREGIFIEKLGLKPRPSRTALC